MVKEKDVTPAILRAVRDNELFGSCLVEIKKCDGWTLGKGELKEHQRRALELAHERMYFKIPDAGWQNPCDAFVMKNAEAYLVVYWTQAREAWALDAMQLPEAGKGITYEYMQNWGYLLKLE